MSTQKSRELCKRFKTHYLPFSVNDCENNCQTDPGYCPFIVVPSGEGVRRNKVKGRPQGPGKIPRTRTRAATIATLTGSVSEKHYEDNVLVYDEGSSGSYDIIEKQVMEEYEILHGFLAVSNQLVTPGLAASGDFSFRSAGTSSYQQIQLTGDYIRADLLNNFPVIESFNDPNHRLYDLIPKLRDIRQRAIKRMIPTLTTGFSLPVFVAELRDFKSFFDVFSQRGRTALGNLPKELRTAPLATLTDLIASGHLTWQFAIAPFISDLKKIHNILLNFQKRTKVFFDGSRDLETVRHFRTAVSQDYLENMLSVDVEVPSIGDVCPLVPTLEPQIHSRLGEFGVNQTMLYDYYCEKLINVNDEIIGLFQQLGVKPDASIIWNLIPLSFIIDWFVPVGDWLSKNASLELVEAELNIHLFAESFRIWTTYSPSSSWQPSWFGVPTLPCVSKPDMTSVIKSQYYHRYFTDDFNYDEIDKLVVDPGISLSRVAISASLFRKVMPRYR